MLNFVDWLIFLGFIGRITLSVCKSFLLIVCGRKNDKTYGNLWIIDRDFRKVRESLNCPKQILRRWVKTKLLWNTDKFIMSHFQRAFIILTVRFLKQTHVLFHQCIKCTVNVHHWNIFILSCILFYPMQVFDVFIYLITFLIVFNNVMIVERV